jgi:hypothetical protein
MVSSYDGGVCVVGAVDEFNLGCVPVDSDGMSFTAGFEHIGDSSQAVGACREFHGDRSVPVWFGVHIVHIVQW